MHGTQVKLGTKRFDVSELLSKVPILQGLGLDDQRTVAGSLKLVHALDRQPLVLAGEVGHTMYFLVRGAAQAEVRARATCTRRDFVVMHGYAREGARGYSYLSPPMHGQPAAGKNPALGCLEYRNITVRLYMQQYIIHRTRGGGHQEWSAAH